MSPNKSVAGSIDELVEGCIKGKRDMQSRLFYTSYPTLLAVISRYIKNDDDRKEILQECFIKIFSGIKDLKQASSYNGWSRRIAINLCMDYWRKNNSPVELNDNIHPLAYEGEEGDEENMLDHITMEDVHEILEEVSPGYRTVFMMFAIDGLSHKEIAITLGTSESNSKSQYLRAKKAIKNLIIKKINHAGKVRP